jgi:hypothetical protein
MSRGGRDPILTGEHVRMDRVIRAGVTWGRVGPMAEV